MGGNVTRDLATLAFAAREALDALDKLCERSIAVPDAVWLARENLTILSESLAVLEREALVKSRHGG